MRKYFLLSLILMVMFLLYTQSKCIVAPHEELSANLNTEQTTPLEKMPDSNWWENEVLTAEGHGLVRAGETDIGNARIRAKRAAMMDGYRNLARAAGKIQITAKDTLSEEKIEVLIKGATVLSETYDEHGNCTVVLSVPIYGVTNSVAKAAFNPVEKENFPAPSRDVTAKGNYTGLIIDCGDLELNPVLSPVIRDTQNQSVYGYENLDYEKVIAKGMIGYVEKNSVDFRNNSGIMLLSSGKNKFEFVQVGSKALLANSGGNLSRAGDNPLIIKAERISDDNTCPVISEEDKDRILSENLVTHFLDEGAVVFTSNRIRGMRM